MSDYEGPAAPAPPAARRPLLVRLGVWLLWIAGACAAMTAALLAICYFAFGPRNMPKEQAGTFTEVLPGEEVLRAYYGVRWLDSQRYFVIKAPKERIAPLFEGLPPPGDEDWQDWTTGQRVRGKSAPSPGERLPGWWDVRELADVVVYDKRASGRHDGETRIYSLEKGLIYVIDR